MVFYKALSLDQNQVQTKLFKMKRASVFIILLAFLFSAASCSNQSSGENQAESSKEQTNSWYKDATIYEVNIRQYTEEGTFKAFQEHLPRLKKLGVDILWIMPIHPIGEKNRKGELGSYYSVKDYKAINPEFGNKEDFQNLVNAVHDKGMHIIIDWVANHTAWDHKWVNQHPEWYKKDSAGNMIAPYDWTDVVALDYEKSGVRNAMRDAMKYWVEDFNIDGYRCDVAGMVPVDFWENTVNELDKIKPVFMLAEDESEVELLDNAFEMHYGWEFHHLTNQLAKNEAKASVLTDYFSKTDSLLDEDDVKMNFLTNHDENSWNGTIKERLGDAHKTMAVLYYTVPGMPLIYTGQEIGLDKRLEFFKKDPIQWNDSPLESFYAKLNTLKEENEALWAPDFGGSFEILETNHPEKAFVFKREKGRNVVAVLLNLTGNPIDIKTDINGKYISYFSKEEINADGTFAMPSWGYQVLVKE